MRLTFLLRASLSLSLGWLAFSASGQVTMTTSATNSGKSYLGVDNRAVVTNIDTLFARLNAFSSSVGSLTWADVLDNGAQASQDLDLNGHIATGANRIEADSLEATRAEIMDSLLVRGDADFDGNLLVGEWARALALRADSSLAVSGAASNWNTAALGGSSSATGVNAVAIGGFAAATNTQATAIGSQAAASGVNSVAIGESSSAVGTQSVALGKSASVASSNANVAVGVNASVAAGWGNIAVGGGRLTGSGNPTNNVAIGSSTISSDGAYNTSIGYSSTISGGFTTGAMTFGPSSSVSTGYRNMAFGANSAITGGNSNYTFGDNSSANGGWNSAAFGNYSQIQSGGDNAYAFGPYSSVSAYNAANFASNSPARFSNIALFGSYADTTALVPGVFSASNWIATDPLFVVANGASDGARSNALTILKDGTATFNDSVHVVGNTGIGGDLNVAGDLYVGGVQVVPGGGGGAADPTAIWLGTMTYPMLLVGSDPMGPTTLFMDLVDEEDNANVFSTSTGSVTVGAPGIYEIQSSMFVDYTNSSNDGILTSIATVNGVAVNITQDITGFVQDGPQMIATARSTSRLRLNAGSVVSLQAFVIGAGIANVLAATLNVEKVD